MQALTEAIVHASSSKSVSSLSAGVLTNVSVLALDASSFPSIRAHVFATDGEGHPIVDLPPSSFIVEESAVFLAPLVTSVAGTLVDIVLVFDTTGSMGDVINQAKQYVINFVDSLVASGLDFRLGLVTFGDEIRQTFSLTSDANQFRGYVNSLYAYGGGDGPENQLDALIAASRYDFRAEAQPVVVLITDAPPHVRGDGSGYTENTISDVVSALTIAGAKAFYWVDPAEAGYWRDVGIDLYAIYDLIGESLGVADFSTILINRLGEVLGNRYLLTYTTPKPSRDGTLRVATVAVTQGSIRKLAEGTYSAPIDLASIQGIVTGRNEGIAPTPLPGATVIALDLATGAVAKTAVTGVDGTYLLENLAVGKRYTMYAISVSKAGYYSKSRVITVNSPGNIPSVNFELTAVTAGMFEEKQMLIDQLKGFYPAAEEEAQRYLNELAGKPTLLLEEEEALQRLVLSEHFVSQMLNHADAVAESASRVFNLMLSLLFSFIRTTDSIGAAIEKIPVVGSWLSTMFYHVSMEATEVSVRIVTETVTLSFYAFSSETAIVLIDRLALSSFLVDKLIKTVIPIVSRGYVKNLLLTNDLFSYKKFTSQSLEKAVQMARSGSPPPNPPMPIFSVGNLVNAKNKVELRLSASVSKLVNMEDEWARLLFIAEIGDFATIGAAFVALGATALAAIAAGPLPPAAIALAALATTATEIIPLLVSSTTAIKTGVAVPALGTLLWLMPNTIGNAVNEAFDQAPSAWPTLSMPVASKEPSRYPIAKAMALASAQLSATDNLRDLLQQIKTAIESGQPEQVKTLIAPLSTALQEFSGHADNLVDVLMAAFPHATGIIGYEAMVSDSTNSLSKAYLFFLPFIYYLASYVLDPENETVRDQTMFQVEKLLNFIDEANRDLNSAIQTLLLRNVEIPPTIAIKKIVGPPVVNPNEPFTVQVTVTNLSAGAAHNVSVTLSDFADSGVTLHDPGSTIAIGTLEGGQDKSVSWTLSANGTSDYAVGLIKVGSETPNPDFETLAPKVLRVMVKVNRCGNVVVSSTPKKIEYKNAAKRSIRVMITNNSRESVRILAISPQADEPFTISKITPPLPVSIGPKTRKVFRVDTQRLARATAVTPYFNINVSCGVLTDASEPRLLVPLAPGDVRLQWLNNQLYLVGGSGSIKSLRLELFDLSGRRLVDRTITGDQLVLPAVTDKGKLLANGVYLYILTVSGEQGQLIRTEIRKLVIMR
jgi:hypothetical protein